MKTALTKALDWTAGKLTTARDAIRDLRGAESAIREQHDATVAERGRLLGMKAPRQDLEVRRDVEIEALGRLWATGRSADLVATLSGSMVPTPTGGVEGPVYHANIVNVVGELNLAALCFLAPELVRAGLTRLLDVAPEFDSGEPMDTRVARIAEVDARLADLGAQHAQLVAEAAGAGIVLEHLEPNRVRRLQDARRAEREAREGARRA